MPSKPSVIRMSLVCCTAGLLLIGCSRDDAQLSFNNIANSINGAGANANAVWSDAPPPVEVADHSGSATKDGAGANGKLERPDPSAVVRKIVYNADVTLSVRDLDDTRRDIQALVEKRGGYLANFSEQRTSGNQRSGHWVVRVPSESFQPLLGDVEQLGVPTSQQIRSQELTEEFIDLEARLKTKRKLEQQMLKIMEKRADDIDDALAASERLNDVRLSIEQIEGRLRKLNDLVALSTLTIDAHEEVAYTPPQAPAPPAPPSFSQTIGMTFDGSMERLTEFGKRLLLAVVAVAPWLVSLCLLAGPVALIMAVARRFSRTPQAT